MRQLLKSAPLATTDTTDVNFRNNQEVLCGSWVAILEHDELRVLIMRPDVKDTVRNCLEVCIVVRLTSRSTSNPFSLVTLQNTQKREEFESYIPEPPHSSVSTGQFWRDESKESIAPIRCRCHDGEAHGAQCHRVVTISGRRSSN